MAAHLTFTKWRDSAFSTEQLKTTRWLLGARPKNVPEVFSEVLSVTPLAQSMLMELHVASFLEASRRVKPSARGRLRPSTDAFEKLVDYSCIFAALRSAAKRASSDKSVDDLLVKAFMAKHFDCMNLLSTYCHCLLSCVGFCVAFTEGLLY